WAADRATAEGALARADRALAGLAARPAREISESGAAVAAQLRAERAALDE
ncbi:MAG: hypothetical protein HOY79_44780, partial [Streptomyces sp.]|nr:hypothetical protein [Streptomyces sp.]